jgi:Transposase DDE domain
MPATFMAIPCRCVVSLTAERFRGVPSLSGPDRSVPHKLNADRRHRCRCGKPKAGLGATRSAARSSGLQVYGAGQWLEAKHAAKSRRKWRKLHLAVDAARGMIVAQTLADQNADDLSQVGPPLNRIDGLIVRVIAGAAYDGAPTTRRSQRRALASKW